MAELGCAQLARSFAISTAIEPDILLIDEGIGAGDAAFLEKAKKRLEDLIERTRILVLASHDEQLVRRWCGKSTLSRLFSRPLRSQFERWTGHYRAA